MYVYLQLQRAPRERPESSQSIFNDNDNNFWCLDYTVKILIGSQLRGQIRVLIADLIGSQYKFLFSLMFLEGFKPETNYSSLEISGISQCNGYCIKIQKCQVCYFGSNHTKIALVSFKINLFFTPHIKRW